MDWFKTDARIAFNPKVARLTLAQAGAYVFLLGYATLFETGGRLPENVARLIPKVTNAHLRALEAHGFLERAGDAGWVLHDYADHQKDALAWQQRKADDAARKKRKRAEEADPSKGSRERSEDASADSPQTEERREEEKELPTPRAVPVDYSSGAGASRTASERGERPKGKPRRPSDIVAGLAEGRPS